MPEKSKPSAPIVYIFERSQLCDLLGGTIDMFLEYRDHHDRSEADARGAAVVEMFDGLDAERELVAEGTGYIATSQIIPGDQP